MKRRKNSQGKSMNCCAIIPKSRLCSGRYLVHNILCILAIVLLFSSGCSPDPEPKAQNSKDEIVGVWKVDREYVFPKGTSPPQITDSFSIVMRSDNTFTACNVPAQFFFPDDPNYEKLNGDWRFNDIKDEYGNTYISLRWFNPKSSMGADYGLRLGYKKSNSYLAYVSYRCYRLCFLRTSKVVPLETDSSQTASDDKTGTVQRLSSLSPLLGKDIQLYGVSVIASTKEKCLPYFLINNKRNLRVHLGFTNDQAYSAFLKAIKTGSNYKEDSQYAEISGRLQYALDDLSLEKNKKFKEDLEHGELDYPYPSPYGEFTLTDPKVIRIIDKPADADLTIFPIKQTPPKPEGNNIKDTCFVGDGNMKKFIEYIEDLKKKNN